MSGSVTNTWLTPDMVTKMAIPLFVNSNAFLKNIDRQYSDQFARDGAKIGDNLRIRLPSDYSVSSGPALAPQAITQVNTNLTVTNQEHIDLVITSADYALDMMEWEHNILKPAINRLAGKVASDIMSLSNTIPNVSQNLVSGALASPSTLTYATAKAVLLQNSTPNADLIAVMDPISMARGQQNIQGLFNPTGRVSEAFDSGEVIGPALGISKYMSDQLVPTYTSGGSATPADMPTVNGANQTGSVITVTPATGGANINVGDVITFAGVHRVNRVTHTAGADLRTFVVTAAYIGGTGTTLSIYPALTPTKGADVPFATTDVSPASGAPVAVVIPAATVVRKNFVMHPKAFTLATVDLPLYSKGVVSAARDSYDGVSFRCLQTYYPQTDQLIMRLDVLYGYAAIRPEWAVVVPDVE